MVIEWKFGNAEMTLSSLGGVEDIFICVCVRIFMCNYDGDVADVAAVGHLNTCYLPELSPKTTCI